MQCPKCAAAMKTQTRAAIQVDQCTGCAGLWFDAGELEKILEIRSADALDSGSPSVGRLYNHMSHIACPRCQIPMIHTCDAAQPHIRFESCKRCHGHFLDAGELRDLNHHTLADYIRDLLASAQQ
jgi:uncharacterized protein